MGAWGHRSFQNDSALDWIGELQGARVGAVTRALQRIPKRGYVEVDDASAAIAAAEVVAAARGHACTGLPDEVADWLDANAKHITARHAVLARTAVLRVQTTSELQELWAEGRKPKNEWTREVDKLLARLDKKPVARKARKPVRKPARAPREQFPEIKYRSEHSPDDNLRAVVSEWSGQSTVSIEALSDFGGDTKFPIGGGSCFAAVCALDDIALRWIKNAALEIKYPARLSVLQRDDSWFFSGRTVAVRYKTTSA